jgi:secondary thiamine-phosphate synthase enzyme
MICESHQISVSTDGFSDIVDITDQVQDLVSKTGLYQGVVTVFTPGATASVTTIEYESGAIRDMQRVLELVASQNQSYEHNKRWHDGNGFSHVRSALLGPSLAIPVNSGSLTLGTWQQIVIVDHDNGPRSRTVVVQLMGTDGTEENKKKRRY